MSDNQTNLSDAEGTTEGGKLRVMSTSFNDTEISPNSDAISENEKKSEISQNATDSGVVQSVADELTTTLFEEQSPSVSTPSNTKSGVHGSSEKKKKGKKGKRRRGENTTGTGSADNTSNISLQSEGYVTFHMPSVFWSATPSAGNIEKHLKNEEKTTTFIDEDGNVAWRRK